MAPQVIEIDKKSRAKYQLMQYFRSSIESGKYRHGDRLPTTDELIKAAGVSGKTIRNALGELAKEGLLKTVRGSGTYVLDKNRAGEKTAEPSRKSKLVSFAVLRAVGDTPLESDRYMADSLRGFHLECKQQHAVAIVPPWTPEELRPEEFCEKFTELSISGVVCIRPLAEQWATIHELARKGFPIVVTSRSQISGQYPCVSGDYFQAGIRAANHFVGRGCDKVLVFNYRLPETSISQDSLIHSEWPAGVKEGLELIYSQSDNAKGGRILENVYLSSIEPKETGEIFEHISKLRKNEGVVFTHEYHLYHLLKEKGKTVIELLKSHPVVLIANCAFLDNIKHLVDGLDISLLIDPFESIARHAVQKLAAIIDGYKEDTMTLVKVPFLSFEELKGKAF